MHKDCFNWLHLCQVYRISSVFILSRHTCAERGINELYCSFIKDEHLYVGRDPSVKKISCGRFFAPAVLDLKRMTSLVQVTLSYSDISCADVEKLPQVKVYIEGQVCLVRMMAHE